MKDDTTKKRTNGDGSVYYRASDNRWCASLSLRSLDGTPHRITRTVPAKGTAKQQEAAARAKLVELKRERDKNGGDIPTAVLNVATWAQAWLATDVEPELRPKTAQSYRTTVEQYIIPAIGTKQLVKLTPDHVRQVIAYVTEKGLSSRSAALAYQVLSMLLKAAYREGKVARNVADLVKRPRMKAETLKVLSADDAIKVLQVVSNDRLGSRWAAAFLTGARQGELLGLELDRVGETLDLSWQLQRIPWRHGCGARGEQGWPCGKTAGTSCPQRKIIVPVDHELRHLAGGLYLSRPKSTAGWRVIPLVEPLRTIIQRRAEVARQEPNTHGLLWTNLDGSPLDPWSDNNAWHDVLVRAGFEETRPDGTVHKQINLHSARHTTVDLLYQANVAEVDIQEIVGHSAVAVTRGYRSKGNQLRLTEALTRMSALMIEPH